MSILLRNNSFTFISYHLLYIEMNISMNSIRSKSKEKENAAIIGI